jgi:RNase P subunit RPR2
MKRFCKKCGKKLSRKVNYPFGRKSKRSVIFRCTKCKEENKEGEKYND